MTPPLFLDEAELRDLTGRKLRRLQVEALAAMGVPYRINAAGRPVVCRAHVEGRTDPASAAAPTTWKPAVLN